MKIPPKTLSHGRDLTDMDAELHQIESEAYGAVLRALTARGGPTWDHLDTLFSLRKELRISEAEHKKFIAQVASDDTVNLIRQWREGTAEEKKLPLEGTNPPPLRSISQTSFKRLKNSHVQLSSFSKSLPDNQPLPATNHSSFATHYSSHSGGVARHNEVISHNQQASMVSKGTILKSKKAHQLSDAHHIKKRFATVEIRATNQLIHEVERIIYGGTYPNPDQMENAKLLLKDQERAIVDALEKLAEFSDDEDELQKNGHKKGTQYAFYDQLDTTKGYYNNATNVGLVDGGGHAYSQSVRYLETP